VGQPVNGDRIYNGALDNASGIALLLEIARAFTKTTPRPRRSLLFVSVTGEEAGLLGSAYFANYPTVSKDAIAANVNIDADLMLWPMEDIIAFGEEHSSLKKIVTKAAQRMRLEISPDPMPEQMFFSGTSIVCKQGVPPYFHGPASNRAIRISPPAIFRSGLRRNTFEDLEQRACFSRSSKYGQFVFLCGI
jgi:Zn-dependent M28 family amino/carboxypeptidase